MGVRKVPRLLVVTVRTTVVSKSRSTVSLAPNPVPFTFIIVVGGPDFTFSVMLELSARTVDLAEMSQAKLTAKTTISRSTMLIFTREKKRIGKNLTFKKHLSRGAMNCSLYEFMPGRWKAYKLLSFEPT